ncbi:MAG: hypothetical protein WDO73_34335 [Ignavibacteriota bacterium]
MPPLWYRWTAGVTAGATASITVNGRVYTYTLNAFDTLDSVRNALVVQLNRDPQVSASIAGVFDRIILRARVQGPQGNGIPITGNSTGGSLTVSVFDPQTCCSNIAGAAVTPTNQAVPGELVYVFATGLGLPTLNDNIQGLIQTGLQYPTNGPATVPQNFVSSQVGGSTADVLQATMLPGTVGMNQVLLHLNSSLVSSTATLATIAQNTFTSNQVTFPLLSPSGQSGLDPRLTIVSSHTGNFYQGQQNASYTLSITNNGGGNPTNGLVTVTETLPTGMTLVQMIGDGWNCNGNVCTRSDALLATLSYPVITVIANVASSATSPQSNVAKVTGGGSATSATTDVTVINTTAPSNPPSLTISKTHTGNFTQGQQNATYTITVGNKGGASFHQRLGNRDGCLSAGPDCGFDGRHGLELFDQLVHAYRRFEWGKQLPGHHGHGKCERDCAAVRYQPGDGFRRRIGRVGREQRHQYHGKIALCRNWTRQRIGVRVGALHRGLLLGGWFVFFSRDVLGVRFSPDDMMNIDNFYWSPGVWRLFYSQFLIWRGLLPADGRSLLSPHPLRLGTQSGAVSRGALPGAGGECLAVYRLARRLGAEEWAAWLAALVACYHAGLANLYYNTAFVYDALCGCFYLAAAVYYCRIRGSGRRLSVRQIAIFAGLFLCALNSKEMALTLPAILLVYEWGVPFRRQSAIFGGSRLPRCSPCSTFTARFSESMPSPAWKATVRFSPGSDSWATRRPSSAMPPSGIPAGGDSRSSGWLFPTWHGVPAPARSYDSAGCFWCLRPCPSHSCRAKARRASTFRCSGWPSLPPSCSSTLPARWQMYCRPSRYSDTLGTRFWSAD